MESASDGLRLAAAMGWLARAQTPGGGVSAAFSWRRGWLPAYPETTGYIVNSFLAYARRTGRELWAERAAWAGEFLLGVQMEEGAFPGGLSGERPVARVFNTGQILLGLGELTRETGEARYAESGARALAWLVEHQDHDGSWTRVAPEQAPHAYHSRVAWGMLEMASALDRRDEFLPAVEAACAWVLEQQDADGWFRNNDLIAGLPPLTHNLAYVLRGLLECGSALKRAEWVEAAERGALALRRDWESAGVLAAGYAAGWQRGPSFRCVTGEAQLGLVWHALAGVTGDNAWRAAARGIADQVSATQSLHHPLAGVRGAIPGARPLWSRYLRLGYPNWATKFHADLLMTLEGNAA